MEVIMPKNVAESWIQLITWGCGLIGGLFGIIKGLILFSMSNELRRAELLKSLLNEYNSDRVCNSLQAIDEDKVAYSKKFLLPLKLESSVRLADPALLFFSNVCYLRSLGLIKEKEFSFFKWKIVLILGKQPIGDYIDDCVNTDPDSPYKYILQLVRETIFQKVKRFLQKVRKGVK
jgi:hypothetical protein